MKVHKEGNTIIIILASELEANIMAACLNWGVSAMSKSNMINTEEDDEDTQKKAATEEAMWREYCTVNTYHGD